MARKSWFAQMRADKNDPNFFNKLDPNDISNNVKRIINDLYYGRIEEQDYVYFKNATLVNAIIIEAEQRATEAGIIATALNYYIQSMYGVNYSLGPNMMAVNNVRNKYDCRAKNWMCIHSLFRGVANGDDPYAVLKNIQLFERGDLYNLY